MERVRFDYSKLRGRIVEKGMTQGKISQDLGILEENAKRCALHTRGYSCTCFNPRDSCRGARGLFFYAYSLMAVNYERRQEWQKSMFPSPSL